MNVNAFSPTGATASATTVVGSTAAVAIPGTGGSLVMVYNSGANNAFIRFGNSAMTDASVTDIPLPPNSMMPYSFNPAAQTHFKVFSGNPAQLVYVLRGDGT